MPLALHRRRSMHFNSSVYSTGRDNVVEPREPDLYQRTWLGHLYTTNLWRKLQPTSALGTTCWKVSSKVADSTWGAIIKNSLFVTQRQLSTMLRMVPLISLSMVGLSVDVFIGDNSRTLRQTYRSHDYVRLLKILSCEQSEFGDKHCAP